MKVDGGCHCGAVRYEAEVHPDKVIMCHCTDCQTLSGSAFRTVVQSLPGSFRLLSGALTTYVKRAESGKEREQTFCPVCGTPIYSAPVDRPDGIVGLRVGSIRQREALVPQDQFWCRSAQPWLNDPSKIRCQETQPVFGPSGAFSERNGGSNLSTT
jgi:hypothetical protein